MLVHGPQTGLWWTESTRRLPGVVQVLRVHAQVAGEGGCSPVFPAVALLPAAIFSEEPLWRGWCLIGVGKSFPGPRRLRLRGQGGDQSSPRCWPWRAAARQCLPVVRSHTPAPRWLVLGRWGFYGCPVGARRRRPGLKRGFGLLGGLLGLQRPWRRGVDGDAHAGALWAPVGCHGGLGVHVGACVPSG